MLLLLIPLVFSCTRAPAPRTFLDERSRVEAESLFVHIQRDLESGAFERAGIKAREIIHNYPEFPRIDDVYLLAAQAAFSRRAYSEAAKYASAIPERYPTSPQREAALLLAAQCFTGLQSYLQSADALLQVLSSAADPEIRAQASLELRRIAREHLRPHDLEELTKKYPRSTLSEDLSLAVAKKEFARGNYAKAYELLAELLYRFPEGRNTIEARRLLKLSAIAKREPPGEVEFVDPFRIGAIFPITGPYSLYGRYFEQGLSTALEEYNASREFPVTLVKADTKGNPIDAVSAVRKLAIEEGAVAIIGSVFTVPTLAASIEANAWKIAFLSPVVSSGEITEVGPWVFQTEIPDEVEVTAIAEVAVSLLIERFAVLAPSFGGGRRAADFFCAEIERLGGVVVAEGYYDEGETDFREQLEKIREGAPEALFVPGSTEELILILPQIRFYDIQVQLLGLGNWNSEKLIRLSGREMEGALFPLDAYHGKDRATYERFISASEERFGGEVNPITVAAYFGMRLLLESMAMGVANREQLRDHLHHELCRGAQWRMAEAAALSILTIRRGTVREFSMPSVQGP